MDCVGYGWGVAIFWCQVTGEHGAGMQRMEPRADQFSDDSLEIGQTATVTVSLSLAAGTNPNTVQIWVPLA